MAGLTASGIGSGLDIESLVSQLMSLEQRPLTQLDVKEASYQAQLSAFGQLKSSLSALQSAARGLEGTAKFSATKATVADGNLLSASSSTTASVGTYSVDVLAIAKTQRTATSGTTEFSPVAGNLTVTFGSVTGGVFTPGTGTPKSITFAGGTLEDLRDAINDGDLGVTASVVNNGTVDQLVLTGNSTGADQAFKLSGTAGLSFDPATTTTSSDPVYSVQAAQNAQVKVDGITVSRSNNTIEDVIKGVTLNLTEADPGNPTTVTVAADKSGARSSIDALIKAYNDLNSTIKALTAFDEDTKVAAALNGDATARSIQTQMRSLFGSAISGLNGLSRLSDMGISFQSDGTLLADSAKLNAALNDPTKDVAGFFAGVEGVTGFSKALSQRVDQFNLTNGAISGRTVGLKDSIDSLDKQREAINARLVTIEARYRKQFTALDSLVSSFSQTSTFLTQQLANLPSLRLNSN